MDIQIRGKNFMKMLNRYRIILWIAAAALLIWGIKAAADLYLDYRQDQLAQALTLQDKEFNKDILQQMAKTLAQAPYVAPADKLPKELAALDYDRYRDIRFSRENGPWYGKKLPFEIQFFHPGSLFQTTIPLNEVINGKSRPLKYSPTYFDYGKNKLDARQFADLGYAGFRLHTPLNNDYYDELISFLGASYFRALGKNQKYGLSARGLAIDTAVQTGEEFPIFREFWIVRPKRKNENIVVYALLDSPSAAGAYTFTITPGENTVIDVDMTLYPRKEIQKLGIAPLTSMYLFGENTKNKFDDHRPEVHDSDGLLVLNGSGEWLWRPLDNSKHLRISAFVDRNPKGFGLLQRDRNPAHYLDFEADYEQRPSVWVEPLGEWGRGWVELVEIPSQQEIHDNVVAYWVPKEKAKPMQELHYQYRLFWFTKLPVEKIPGDITATYTGIGGVSGMLETQKRKFVIDFDILNMADEVEQGIAELEVSATEGEIAGKHLMYNPVTKGLTAYIDFIPNGKTSELRAAVVKKGKKISEIWSYQWLP